MAKKINASLLLLTLPSFKTQLSQAVTINLKESTIIIVLTLLGINTVGNTNDVVNMVNSVAVSLEQNKESILKAPFSLGKTWDLVAYDNGIFCHLKLGSLMITRSLTMLEFFYQRLQKFQYSAFYFETLFYLTEYLIKDYKNTMRLGCSCRDGMQIGALEPF